MAPRKNVKKTFAKSNAEQKKFTYSKILLFANNIVTFAMIAVTVIGAFKGYDVSAVCSITLALIAETGTCDDFYFSKAKKENTLKIAMFTVEKFTTDKVDDITKIIDSIGRLV